MPSPRVSVIMLTFNRPQYIGRAIESIVNQTLTDWELIVVHDGPNREIETVMREWEARESRVRYFRRTEWSNIADATNFGIRNARGAYLAILDDDDFWKTPDKLERQARFLDEHPDYVGCGGGAKCVGHDGAELMSYLKPENDDEIKSGALLANPMIHSTTVYRRAAAESVGYYDESLAGFQDWDFFLKLGRIGKLYNFPEHFLAYQIWEGGGSFERQKRNTRSALQIVQRHGKYYGGYWLALSMALMYHTYSHLPLAVRRQTFSSLTQLKKTVFARRASA